MFKLRIDDLDNLFEIAKFDEIISQKGNNLRFCLKNNQNVVRKHANFPNLSDTYCNNAVSCCHFFQVVVKKRLR